MHRLPHGISEIGWSSARHHAAALARACIAPKVARLNASHPDLQLVLLPGTALATRNKGEADVAIRSVRPEDDGLIRKGIGAVRFGLYSSAEFSRHLAEHWKFISYDQSLDIFRSKFGCIASARGAGLHSSSATR